MTVLFLSLFSNGCLDIQTSRYVLKQDDITAEKSITSRPDKELEVKVNWSLLPETRVNHPTELYYPPYLVIVPPDIGEWYHYKSSFDGYKMYTLASLPHEVIDNVLDKIPDYKWEKNSQIRFGWEVYTNSFEQGTVSILFKQAKEPVSMEPFKIYFIYYDPIAKKGWVKLL